MFGRKPQNKHELPITISNHTFIRLALMTVATVILLAAVRKASHAILLIFCALFLTLALNAPVHWLSKQLPGKRRGNRTLATTLSFLIVIILLGAFLASIVPPLVHQTENFLHQAPRLVRDLHSQNSAVGRLIRHYHLENQVNKLSQQLSARLEHIGGTAFSTLQKIGTSIFSIVTILVLTFMMLIEGPRWLKFIFNLIPEPRRPLARQLADDMYAVIRGFVNGQVTLAAIASALIVPALFILHISYPVALMVVIFICGLIPLVGHTIGAIIVTAVALFHSTTSTIIILAYYILYQQLENYLIQPRIQASATNMSPLFVFMAVVIGVSFGGLFGGLFAIPIAGCLRVAVLEYLEISNIISEPAESTAETR